MDTLTEMNREALRVLLDQCTPRQQGLFNRMYGSIEAIKADQMKWACKQIERTIEKNKAKSKEQES